MPDSPRALELVRDVARRNEGDGGDSPEVRAPAFTDKGNGERLAKKHGHELRFCTDWNRWLIWNGIRWAVDKTGEVMRMAKVIAAEIIDERAIVVDFKELQSHCNKSQSLKGLEAMIRLAGSELPIPITSDLLDVDPYLFNCGNGTLNLQSGEFREARRDELLTKHTPVEYDPEATCPIWLAFLDQVMDKDEGLISFLQRAVGYSLTGKTNERAIFLLYGKGRNGKSTFLETVRALIGDYAMRTPTETLMQKQRGAIPNDIARLKGARFVIASETEEGKSLAPAKLKELAGGDVVSARFMRAEFFEFMPEFKIWIGTNHKPNVKDSSQAIWDRIKLVPFTVRIADDRQDPNLIDDLKSELPGILNWALEGCQQWVASGLGTAEKITEATKEYQAEQDLVGNFLAECCVLQSVAVVGKGDLYKEYVRWCEDSHEWVLTKKIFGQRLDALGLTETRKAGGERCWQGVGLKTSLPSGNAPSEEKLRAESDRIAEENDLFK